MYFEFRKEWRKLAMGRMDGRWAFGPVSERVFPEFDSPTAGDADTLVVRVLGHVLKR